MSKALLMAMMMAELPSERIFGYTNADARRRPREPVAGHDRPYTLDEHIEKGRNTPKPKHKAQVNGYQKKQRRRKRR